MRSRLKNGFFYLALFIAATLAGCSAEQATGPELTSGKPPLLRNIENSELSVVVRIVEGGYEFIGEQRNNGTWFVQMNLPPDMAYEFVASWYANSKQQRVLLLEQRGQIFAGTSSNVQQTGALESVSVGNGFDADCDGMSNLFEVENGTDPLTIPSSCIDDSPSTKAPMADFALGGRTLCLIDIDGRLECTTKHEPATHLPPDDGTLYKHVGAGSVHACAITQAGDIRCWGDNDFYQQDNIPTSSIGFVELSAGRNHTCALDADGQAHCWGENSNGQIDVPANNQTYTSIHAGTTGTCAIRTSGIALCWSTEPAFNSAFVASHEWLDITLLPDCGLTKDGIIICATLSTVRPELINGPYTKIDSAGVLFCGLQTNGVIDCLGYESENPFAIEHVQTIRTAIGAWPPIVDFELLTSGPSVNGICGLDTNGQIHCAGNRLPADTVPGL